MSKEDEIWFLKLIIKSQKSKINKIIEYLNNNINEYDFIEDDYYEGVVDEDKTILKMLSEITTQEDKNG